MTPIANAQLGTFSSGWVSIDFSGNMPYLVKDTMYRMVVSSDLNNPSGFAWNTSSNNLYTRGYSVSPNIDFTFKTHMMLITQHPRSKVRFLLLKPILLRMVSARRRLP